MNKKYKEFFAVIIGLGSIVVALFLIYYTNCLVKLYFLGFCDIGELVK